MNFDQDISKKTAMLNEDSLERELSCGICFELYDDPLQLPCIHTFCRGCVQDIITNSKGKKLKCPDCRRNVDLGRSGIDSLKRNFKLASIVEVYRQTLEKTTPVTQQSAAVPEEPPTSDNDYQFLSGVLKRSQEDASDPFEPRIIDDLWGTFIRTNRRTISDRPPAPLPPRNSSNGRPLSRPLPPIPPQSPPHSPTDTPSNRSSTPIASSTLYAVSDRHKPPLPAPPDYPKAEPSAPPYFTLSEAHTGTYRENNDVTYDLASLSAPPLPPRSSNTPTTESPRPGALNIDNRPPKPAPRHNRKGLAQPPRTDTADTNIHNDRRRPPPVPPGRQS